MKKTNFELIKERGYIYQGTNEEIIKDIINGKPATFYLGIDPTADSLHIGHFFALTLVRRLQKMGHHPIVVVGAATALVGDPSGRSDLRTVLTKEQVNYNKKEVKGLIERFVDTKSNNKALILDNSEWINPESYIDFMRNVGIHFNVNKMLATDCYKKRLEQGGLTFLEMGYMLMQAYDFVYLNENYNCILQIGGSDQWANMVAGVELARKMDFVNGKKERIIESLTCPLLVKADGEKMGKTSAGTLWISREKTTTYDFYQMFINSYDEDVERLLAFFSDFEMEDIKRMCQDDIREAKKIMAFEVTKLVHGEEEALKAKKAAEALFSGSGVSENMPTINLDDCQEMLIVDLLALSGIISSKSEARRLIDQGGLTINDQKIIDPNFIINKNNYEEGYIVIKKGKKQFYKVVFK